VENSTFGRLPLFLSLGLSLKTCAFFYMDIVAAQRVFFSHPSAPSTVFSVLYSRFYIHVFLGGFGTHIARF
jgi:hypothetical protein